MTRVELDGICCYSEETGAGDPVLLLHGGYCSIETMRPQIDELSGRYRVLAFERPGHGRSPDREGPISFDAMLAETVAYLDAMETDRAHVIGLSDGAILGYLMAIRHPERVRSLVAISGNVHASVGTELAEEELALAMPRSAIDALSQDYERLSPDGPGHRDVIFGKLMEMWKREPNITREELQAIAAPTLVMTADHDVIPLEHIVMIRSTIPNAQLCVIPNASHMLMTDRPELVNLALSEFLESVKP
ncbi:MAG: alpha/beta fold hydrolase [Actinomycetota bacterium]